MISINVLGHPVLSRPDGPVTGRAAYKRRLALLSALAAARGRRVSRERLIGLLWAEHPQDAARHTLSEALYVLRKELGEDVFVVLGDEVGLSPVGARTDVDAFESALEEGRLEDAVRVYGGPFLDGFHVSGAPEFERWVDGERDRLARACARALETLAERAELDDPMRAAGWWRRLGEHDPYSSRVALRLVRALHEAGEHAAALRHAAAHAALLQDDLGVGPDPELTAYVERLRAEALPLPPPQRVPRTAPPTETTGVDELAAEAERPDLLERAPFDAPPAPPEPYPPVQATGGAVLAQAARPAPLSLPDDSPPGVGPLPRSGRRRWLLGGVAGGVAAALAAVLLGSAGRGAAAPSTGPQLDPRRIAVLYFDDYSPGGELGYLANGLTEMLIHELSQVEALDVISRNGVKPYRSGTVPLDSVAARLEVGSVVEGSVQRSGDSVRVTVQLIDAATQSHLESRVVLYPLADLLALESAVAGEVGGFLRRRLGREVRLREAGAGTRSPEARALALRAEQIMDDAESLASGDPLDAASASRLMQRADSLLARAEAADPAWTRPTVLRAQLSVSRFERAGRPRQRALLAQAETLAERVLEREPRNAEALQVRASARWRSAMARPGTPESVAGIDAAERDLRAAVTAEPRLARGWGTLARLLLARGQVAEARLAAERALAADAYLEDAGPLLLRLFFTAMEQADYRTAADVCAEGGRLFPRDWRFVECRLIRLREDPSLPPDATRAWRLVDELERMDPPNRARGEGRDYQPVFRRLVAAALSARAGDTARARRELARARRDAAGNPAVSVPMGYDEAYLLLTLGDRQAARARLDAYLADIPALGATIGRDPLFRALYDSALSGSASETR